MNCFELPGKIFANLPLQISVEPEIKNKKLFLNIVHNIKKAQFEAYARELEIGNRCPPFNRYSNNLYKQNKKPLTICNRQIRLYMEKAQQFRSLWVSLEAMDHHKRRSGSFGIEFLIPPSGENIVIGTTKLGQPKQNFILNDPGEISEEEGLCINTLIDSIDINNKSDFDVSILLMDLIHQKLGQQETSRNLKGGDSVDKVLKAISEGDKVQCGQVTDVLSKIFHRIGIAHRILSLFRYYPPIKDIIVNGHSVIEIFSRELNKWFLIDPSYNSYILYNDKPLSSLEIREKIKADDLNMKIIDNKMSFANNYTAQINYPVRHKGDYDYFCHFNVISLYTIYPGSSGSKPFFSLRRKRKSEYGHGIYPGVKKLGEFL